MRIRKALLLSCCFKFFVILLGVSIFSIHDIFGKIWHSLEDIRAMLASGDDVNVKNDDGFTPLMIAATSGEIDLVRQLIRAGANINAINKDGNTALHGACFGGDYHNMPEMIELLINNGADVRAQNNLSNTPMQSLLEIDNTDVRIKVIRSLVAHGSDINDLGSNGNTITHISVLNNDRVWVTLLVGTFGSLIDFNKKNNEGFTPLEYAQELGFGDVADVLKRPIVVVGVNGNISIRDINGWTGLMLAVMRNDANALQLLVKSGTDLNTYSNDIYKNTALHFAFLFQNFSMIESLVLANANVNQANAQGDTPLHFVMKLMDPIERMRALTLLFSLSNEVNVNAKNSSGNTLAHLIAYKNDIDLAQTIYVSNYKNKIDLTIRNGENKTPLDIAKEKGYQRLIEIFGSF